MKKSIFAFAAVLIMLGILNTKNCFSQWAAVNLGTTNKLSDLCIPENNPNTIFIIGEVPSTGIPYLYKSTNSGVNFTAITSFPSGFYAPRDIYFNGNDTGLVCGYPGLIATTTGGTNWSYMYNSAGTDTVLFSKMCIGVYNSMWLVGNVVYNTTFGQPAVIRCANLTGLGAQFKRLVLPSSWSTYRLSSVWAQDSNNCLVSVVTSNPGIIMKTTNGGVNWTNISINMETWNLIGSDENNNVFAIGQLNGASTIYSSSNFGTTWNPVYSNSGTGALYGIGEEFIRDTMYAVGQNGTVVRSINSGYSWALQSSITGNQLNAVYNKHHNTKFAFAVGDNGIMIKTTNGGIWVQNISTEVPAAFALEQNYPNPFNPETKIKFDVAKQSDVKIIVYDITGREVQTLVNENMKPGVYEVTFEGSGFTSGVYFYKLQTENFTETKRMILVK